MIKGMKEVIERRKSEDVCYIVVEKYFRDVIFEGYFDDLAYVECPGYRVSDEIYIGDGILRIVLSEDN